MAKPEEHERSRSVGGTQIRAAGSNCLIAGLELPRLRESRLPQKFAGLNGIATFMNLLGYSVAAVLVALAAFFIVRKLRRPAANVAPLAPSPVDQNVQFTVYRPKAVAPNRWQTMLAFAHLSDAGRTSPSSLTRLKKWSDRPRRSWQQTANYDQRTQDSGSAVPRGGWITFVPKISGVEFNPAKPHVSMDRIGPSRRIPLAGKR